MLNFMLTVYKGMKNGMDQLLDLRLAKETQVKKTHKGIGKTDQCSPKYMLV